MATLTSDAKRSRRIQFTDFQGKRRTLYLGKLPKKDAQAIKTKVESLIFAKTSGQPVESETARWVASAGDTLHAKLAKLSLIEARKGTRLGLFIDSYIAMRHDVSASTVITYRRARRNLVQHFGEDRDLRSITPGDADEWRLAMLRRGLADNTVRKTSSIAGQFAKAALRKGYIDTNPFADLPSSIKAKRDRSYFITRAEAALVIDACPDAEWRCLFALARYGGLRNPSETLGLRWSDIDWAANRLTVASPKTAHHEGKESRTIPLFPELLPHLQAAFEAAPIGAEFVITRYRDAGVNVRTQLTRIIAKAGLKPWPKLWQNLRSTRETELAEYFPIHVVCAWIGNSVQVAAKHYLQVTEEHFEQGALVNAGATQNPTQHASALSHIEPQTKTKNLTQPHEDAVGCGMMGDEGLEPATYSV